MIQICILYTLWQRAKAEREEVEEKHRSREQRINAEPHRFICQARRRGNLNFFTIKGPSVRICKLIHPYHSLPSIDKTTLTFYCLPRLFAYGNSYQSINLADDNGSPESSFELYEKAKGLQKKNVKRVKL